MENNYKNGLELLKVSELYYRNKSNVDYNEKIADTLKDLYQLIESGHKLNNNEKQIVFNILLEASMISNKQ